MEAEIEPLPWDVRAVRPENALSLGRACSWLTHVLSLPDKEGDAAFTLAKAASTGRDDKSKPPSVGAEFSFLFLVLVMRQFCPAYFPSHSVVMPRMQPFPVEEPVLKVQQHLSAKMLANTGWKPSGLLCLEKT